MSNLDDEINELVEYFQELDTKFNQQVIPQRSYQTWKNKPLGLFQYQDSRKFKVILWENTEKETVVYQSVSKLKEVGSRR